jgi:hypothetical protein
LNDLIDIKELVLSKVDEILSDISGQSLVDSSRMVDFCLDIRQILTKDADE